jgi:nicotinate phosphoribosyltransferase
VSVHQDFATDVERARRWHGLRQDSGDPFVFGPQAKEAYERLGIDPREKTIVYSDWLNVDKAIALKKQCDEIGVNRELSFIFFLLSFSSFLRMVQLNPCVYVRPAAFGIGTFFTNDFKSLSSQGKEKSKALNMVIKLASINGLPCVKISDDLTKVSLSLAWPS